MQRPRSAVGWQAEGRVRGAGGAQCQCLRAAYSSSAGPPPPPHGPARPSFDPLLLPRFPQSAALGGIFTGSTQTAVACSVCRTESTRVEAFSVLSLDLPQAVQAQQAAQGARAAAAAATAAVLPSDAARPLLRRPG